jgi:ATP-dependent Clp protease, protease subunit
MKRKWYDIKNEAGQIEVYIYGYVGRDDFDDEAVSASEFIDAIKPYDALPLSLHINSGGGDVFEGIAIYTAIINRAGKTTSHIDGLAASIASIIAIASDEVLIMSGAMMMIHRASSCTWGNADDFLALAETLQKLDGNLADIYASKTNMSAEEALAAIAKTTWYTAEEAVQVGLADAIDDSVLKAVACIDARFLDRYDVPDPIRAGLQAASDADPNIDTSDEAGAQGEPADEGGAPESVPAASVAFASGIYQYQSVERKRL